MERNKTLALALLAASLVLLALCTAGLEGRPLVLPPETSAVPFGGSAAVDRFGPLFGQEPFGLLLRAENRRDVFTTSHFNKPPAPPPEPEKPKTRTVALTFMGTLSSSGGDVSGFLRIDQTVSKIVPGAKVIQDWGVAMVDRSAMVLTNATQTNRISFQQTLQLTVPIP